MVIRQYFPKQIIALNVTAIMAGLLMAPPIFAAEIPLPARPQIDTIDYFERLSEGQKLLLRPKIGNIIYDSNIYTLKKNGTLYYSLTDVIDVLNLAINFDEDTGEGEGWFLREDWEILINLPDKHAISRNQNHKIEEIDYIEDDNIAFIAQDQIQKWFDFEFDPDIPQQYLEIKSSYPLPIIAKNNRLKKRTSKSSRC